MSGIPGDVIPLALGIAASPFPVIPVVLLLFTSRPRASSLSFLAGWVVGIAVAATIAVALAEVIEFADESPRWLSWVRIALGILLLVLALRQWRARTTGAAPPAWIASLEDATPAAALRLSLILSLANPKIVLLAAAAGLGIGAANLGAATTVGSVMLFVLVAACTVWIPVAVYLLLGDRVLRPIGVLKEWLLANSNLVMAVVLLLLGAMLITEGITSL